jgi:hypothetical protein
MKDIAGLTARGLSARVVRVPVCKSQQQQIMGDDADEEKRRRRKVSVRHLQIPERCRRSFARRFRGVRGAVSFTFISSDDHS